MALITSDCVAMRLPEQIALITSGCADQRALALPCSMGDGTIKVNGDVGTLLSLLQQQIR